MTAAGGPDAAPQEIVLRGVEVRAGEAVVLSGVDLVLRERRVGVVGPNGSGKSTLVRLLNGLVLPSAGTVTVDGLDTVHDGAAVRRRVGFVFTDPDAQLVMPTAAEDVALSLRRLSLAPDERAARVREVLAAYGLADRADVSVHDLSGGQKQLLALAGVLATEPEVLVADEPTTLLDLRNTRAVAELLDGLPQRVVHVTHDLELVESYDRVLVVDDGRVVADDVPGAALGWYRRTAATGRASG